ncbi:glutamyl-tRNA reductase [Varibaculum prostatecancerukia]|uniref:glutamyl-tRNA reductase n=1 Tax=Varibaculum prostatecancerukia TaxID=2811781 RepID=UPI001C0052CD|nr:glutamyl-tRNA reductase [Varibaculum prostatecancerukia]
MGLSSYSVHHLRHGLSAVAAASSTTEGLPQDLLQRLPEVRGVMPLSTCNRVEIIIETAPALSGEQQVGIDRYIQSRLGTDCEIRRDREVLDHLFQVACGLDSMVIGEREISGQLRRALRVATQQRISSATITRACQGALTTSRRVAQLTGIASQGRSVVACGLEIVSERINPLAETPTLLIGTGSYAGAAVAALRAKGVQDISVYSTSGRAERFAFGHDLQPVAKDQLIAALEAATLIVTCRGMGSPVLTKEEVQRALALSSGEKTILDLALQTDIEDGVADLERVRVINLEEISARVPEAGKAQVKRAEEIVAEGVEEAEALLADRKMDSVVVALRDSFRQVLADEVARLPKGDTIPREDVEYALRHLAARLAHIPTINAHRAGREGMGREYVSALQQVWGLDLDTLTGMGDVEPTCPVTGLKVADLKQDSAGEKEAR